MTPPARTVFLGSGSFAVPIVAGLAEHPSVQLVAVVTAPTRARSRRRLTQTPVALWAADRGLPLLQPVRLRAPEVVAEIAGLAPELLVLADYGQIVPAALIDLPRHGALNLHPSLLPRHRGASPIPAAILAGDSETGVTLMRMDAGLDTGPVVAQVTRPLAGNETAPQLEDELARAAAHVLAETLPAWLGGELVARPQDHAVATLTRPLRRSDGSLDLTRTAAELERQVRAYQPWPGSFLETTAGRLVVWQASIGAERGPFPVGRFTLGEHGGRDSRLGVYASDRALELGEVQPAGGRRMSGAEFWRGRAGVQVVLPQAPPDASG